MHYYSMTMITYAEKDVRITFQEISQIGQGNLKLSSGSTGTYSENLLHDQVTDISDRRLFIVKRRQLILAVTCNIQHVQ